MDQKTKGITLNENTKILLPIATLVIMIGGFLSGVVFAVSWKSDVENRLTNVETSVETLAIEGEQRKLLYTETQASLVEIKTDLKWIKTYMMNMEKE